MRTRPDISDDSIVACLRDAFGPRVSSVAYLPVGADYNSFVFRVTADDGTPYFLKLRRGSIAELTVAVPALLHARGIGRVMAPLPTSAGRPWVRAHGFDWILYPFFEGKNGYEVALSRANWIALGESMRAVHSTELAKELPAELVERVPREAYSPRLREIVRTFDRQVERRQVGQSGDDPIAAKLAAFWLAHRAEIQLTVERAELLARALQGRASELVLCHADLHGANVLVGASGELTIVDWDEIILAPKERDLMFVGGGLFGDWNQAMEEAWFYEGYGSTTVDPIALAYYRYERIVADIAAYGDQIFGQQGSAEDREEGLGQLMSQFLPGNVIEIAHRSYR